MDIMSISDSMDQWIYEKSGHLVVALYGLVSLHFWTQRFWTSGVVVVSSDANLALFSKMIGAPTADVEAQRLLDKRRRISFQEIAHVWCYVLDLFLLALFLVQLCGILDPMVRFLPFFFGVATGSEILRRIADAKDSVTPARLDRDVTLMSILVFVSTLGMPREFMPACYMARTLCFSFTCSRSSNKVNLALAPFYVLAHWLTRSPDGAERLEFHIFSEIIAVSFMTLLMTTLDTKEHKLAQASVELEVKAKDLKEAEREGSAAQRLLSVTCDASVRLSHDLAIQTSSHSLLDLLMCHFGNKSMNSLDGTPFVKYIAAADHQRFRDFIAESSSALTPARSLHIQMKDSVGVTFEAELFHVTVPSFTEKQFEHLIGISNESNSADRLGRMENLCPSSDMRHIIGYGRTFGGASLPSRKSKTLPQPCSEMSSQASSNSSGSRCHESQPRYKELQCLKNISMIIDADAEKDFMIRQLTFNFPTSTSCSSEVLPNLLEWLKPHYRERVSNLIVQRARGSPDFTETIQVKTLSPFPGSSVLFVKEMKLTSLSPNENHLPFDGADEELFKVELGQLHAR